MRQLIIATFLILVSCTSFGQDGNGVNNLVEFIKRESIGGELDFNQVLKDKTQGFFLYDGVAYSKKDFAIYLWGKKVKLLGVSSSQKAIILWKEINGKGLTSPENKALVKGFNSKDSSN